MNGIIHGCSHNNDNSNPNVETTSDSDSESESSESDTDSPAPQKTALTEEEIFTNITYYLDRIVTDIVKPTDLVYMAIDGVAPRAKMNQQRARRFSVAKEREISMGISGASQTVTEGDSGGGYAMTFETGGETKYDFPEDEDEGEARSFSPNSITPGTPFLERCSHRIEDFIRHKLSTDPRWSHLRIVFSGPNVPGEGEHKIMQFIREEKTMKDYDPNTRHCVFGQDGDLVMLGLATHEPQLVLLREEVHFTYESRTAPVGGITESVSKYVNNNSFELLHMNILRDYLAYEFETGDVVPTNSSFDIERTVDDFVFLTFFVGNDFLPHMPALNIGEGAFDLLFWIYKRHRENWLRNGGEGGPYLTHSGNIICGKRLEGFLQDLGKHEDPYHTKKKKTEGAVNESIRANDKKYGRMSYVPSVEMLEKEEEENRTKYQEMLEQIQNQKVQSVELNTPELDLNTYTPVLSSKILPSLSTKITFEPEKIEQEEDSAGTDQNYFLKLKSLLVNSMSPEGLEGDSKNEASQHVQSKTNAPVDSRTLTDLKGRYYHDKFNFSPLDFSKHQNLRDAYIKSLVWCLQYYYKGCVSWEWYYPYHYGPMLSDLVDLPRGKKLEKSITFDIGRPFAPYEQLLACMPPASAYVLPKPYRWLILDEDSPLRDYYPESFRVDMNGMRNPWEAVVLLPFIHSETLTKAAARINDDELTKEERIRNSQQVARTHSLDTTGNKRKLISVPYEPKSLSDTPPFAPVLSSGFSPDALPTLKSVPIARMERKKLGLDIFKVRSRYKTAVLVLANETPHSSKSGENSGGGGLPPFPPASSLGNDFVGSTLYFRYPYLQEGLVTSISDKHGIYRGKSGPFKDWNDVGKKWYEKKLNMLFKRYTLGEGKVGSGGWTIPRPKGMDGMMVTVRPLKGIERMEDGTDVKVYGKVEVEIPLMAAMWSPRKGDRRLQGVPAKLERNWHEVGMKTVQEQRVELEKMKKLTLEQEQMLESMSSSVNLESDAKSDTPGVEDAVGAISQQIRSLSTASRPPSGGPSRTSQPLGAQRNFIIRGGKLPLNSVPTKKQNYHTYANNPIAKKAHTFRRVQGKGRVGVLTTAALLAATVMSGIQSRQHVHTYKPRNHIKNKSFGISRWNSIFDVSRGGESHDLDQLIGFKSSPPYSSNSNSQNIVSHDNWMQDSQIESTVDDELDMAPPYHPNSSPPPIEFSHGTTTISFIFQGGIIAAVDSRASIGNFVGSKTTQKVLPVNSHILGTMAGGAADCSFWIRKLRSQAKLHELTKGYPMTVSHASRILSNALYENRHLQLSVGTMIMGYDITTKPSIYYIDNSGVRIQGEMFAIGSGSTFALGILDVERQYDMTVEEAVALGIKAIRCATYRDAFSGGYIGVYLITKKGWKKVFSEDLALLESAAAAQRDE